MSTKIRLARFGRKKRPFYRIMVTDSRAPRDGRHIDYIGFYDPLKNPKVIKIDREKTIHWLNSGAIPSPTTRNLLSSEGILLELNLRKQEKTEDFIKEELQKFDLIRNLKQRNKEKKKEAVLESKIQNESDEERVAGQEDQSPMVIDESGTELKSNNAVETAQHDQQPETKIESQNENKEKTE